MFHPVTFSASGQSPSVTFVHHLTVHSRVLTQRFGPITAGLFYPAFLSPATEQDVRGSVAAATRPNICTLVPCIISSACPPSLRSQEARNTFKDSDLHCFSAFMTPTRFFDNHLLLLPPLLSICLLLFPLLL